MSDNQEVIIQAYAQELARMTFRALQAEAALAEMVQKHENTKEATQ